MMNLKDPSRDGGKEFTSYTDLRCVQQPPSKRDRGGMSMPDSLCFMRFQRLAIVQEKS